jgi:hypothetical protein
MEKLLLEEILRRRDNHEAINMRDIQALAKNISKILYPEVKFLASNGWFSRFVKRFKLSRRTATHIM